jgi:Flp pilus assembly pilin Flp
MAEYVLLATFVTLAAAVAVRALGTSVADLFDTVAGAFPN